MVSMHIYTIKTPAANDSRRHFKMGYSVPVRLHLHQIQHCDENAVYIFSLIPNKTTCGADVAVVDAAGDDFRNSRVRRLKLRVAQFLVATVDVTYP